MHNHKHNIVTLGMISGIIISIIIGITTVMMVIVTFFDVYMIFI